MESLEKLDPILSNPISLPMVNFALTGRQLQEGTSGLLGHHTDRGNSLWVQPPNPRIKRLVAKGKWYRFASHVGKVLRFPGSESPVDPV
jgi:hypothetical protein